MENVLYVGVLPLIFSLPLRRGMQEENIRRWLTKTHEKTLCVIRRVINFIDSFTEAEVWRFKALLLSLSLLICLSAIIFKYQPLTTENENYVRSTNYLRKKLFAQQQLIDSLKYKVNTLEVQNQYIPQEQFFFREFDSRDKAWSGVNMDSLFLVKIMKVQNIVGWDLHINSGYRTHFHNRRVGGVNNSAHKKGLAVDIKATTNEQRFKIIKAAIQVGIPRIGIHKRFIHLDTDTTKKEEIIWLY